jgi:hypothetical protein
MIPPAYTGYSYDSGRFEALYFQAAVIIKVKDITE